MEKEKLFRTCIFGGYNKTDVREYIQRLEEELVKVKSENEGIGNRDFVLKQDVQKNDSDVMILNEIFEGEKDKEQESFFKPLESMDQKKIFEEKVPDNVAAVEHADESLGKENCRLDESKEQQEKVQQELERLKKENRDLQNEVAVLKKEKEDYEEDYRAVKNVLLNAQVDAEITLAKANEKAKMIVAKSQKEAEEKRKESMNILSRCLEDNYHSLMISKDYMEEQVRNIGKAQMEIRAMKDKIDNFQGERKQD